MTPEPDPPRPSRANDAPPVATRTSSVHGAERHPHPDSEPGSAPTATPGSNRTDDHDSRRPPTAVTQHLNSPRGDVLLQRRPRYPNQTAKPHKPNTPLSDQTTRKASRGTQHLGSLVHTQQLLHDHLPFAHGRVSASPMRDGLGLRAARPGHFVSLRDSLRSPLTAIPKTTGLGWLSGRPSDGSAQSWDVTAADRLPNHCSHHPHLLRARRVLRAWPWRGRTAAATGAVR